jgi:hypothetical protein
MGLNSGLLQMLVNGPFTPSMVHAGQVTQHAWDLWHRQKWTEQLCASERARLPPKSVSKADVVLVHDCMADLFLLRPCPPDGCVRVRPEHYYEAFAQQILGRFVEWPALHTYYVVFDKDAYMSRTKQEVQKQRDASVGLRDEKTYDAIQDCVASIDDWGFCMDPKLEPRCYAPAEFKLLKLMRTRRLRMHWYSYVCSKLQNDSRFHDRRLVLDFHPDGPLTLHQGKCTQAHDKLLAIGEGEMCAVGWAVRLSPHFHVMLYSKDSDLVPLTLLHQPRYVHGVMCMVGGHYCNAHQAASVLRQSGWQLVDFVYATIINGTDFVKRTDHLFQVGNQKVFDALTHYFAHRKHNAVGAFPFLSYERFAKLVCYIYAHSYESAAVRRKSKKKGSSALPASAPPPVPCISAASRQLKTLAKRRRMWGKKNKRMQGVPSPSVLQGSFAQVVGNFRYWQSLQGHLTGTARAQEHAQKNTL